MQIADMITSTKEWLRPRTQNQMVMVGLCQDYSVFHSCFNAQVEVNHKFCVCYPQGLLSCWYGFSCTEHFEIDDPLVQTAMKDTVSKYGNCERSEAQSTNKAKFYLTSL